MKAFFSFNSFRVRILLGFVVLIFVTTLSAGVPAFYLTQSQLERQAWTQVDNAGRATRSLLEAEQNYLSDQLDLFAERPTLQQLVRTGAPQDLQGYLDDFRDQIGLDILIFCSPDGQPLAGESNGLACSTDGPQGFLALDDRPVLLARQTVVEQAGGERLGTALAGIWLDRAYLELLVSETGSQQSILLPDGQRLSSSFAAPGSLALERIPRQALPVDGSNYYATYLPLSDGDGRETLYSEVALNVDDLVATERRAFSILALSTGLVALLGMALSIAFVRQVNAPLQKLTATAEKISRGDLMAAIPLFSGPAEIRTLAAALHRSQASMLQALHERSEVGERLNTILQSIVEGVVTCDKNGRVTFWSEGAHNLLGWSPEEAIGADIEALFPLSETEETGFFEQVPTGGQKRQFSIRTRAGETIVLALTASELIPPGSDSPQRVLVLRDVTEEEAARRLRSYFLANISHEFRTPLSTLIASMELLMDEGEDYTAAEVRQLIRPTHVSLLSLQTLIDNLLESSSIEAGQFRLQRRSFDIREAIDSALDIARPLLERRQQPFRRKQMPAPALVEGDPARLTQALANLIINASKYSPIGEPIELQTESRDDCLWVGISDHGPGIPPAERGNIFRSFKRLDSGDREQYGIGLGLYVVKTVIEAHGGEVGVTDASGGGSLFWFRIPSAQGGQAG